MFEGQVKRRPEAIATVHEGQSLSYAELNRRANRIAHYLRDRGLRAEARIGICMQRSAEMVIALLGVLKAGGCYVPLDPNYPDERLNALLDDAQPCALVTQARLAARFAQRSEPVVELDQDRRSAATEMRSNLRLALAPENLAYVIYTSGSTGKPKGVLITHRSLVNHNLAMANVYELRPEDRVLQFAACSFDVAAEVAHHIDGMRIQRFDLIIG